MKQLLGPVFGALIALPLIAWMEHRAVDPLGALLDDDPVLERCLALREQERPLMLLIGDSRLWYAVAEGPIGHRGEELNVQLVAGNGLRPDQLEGGIDCLAALKPDMVGFQADLITPWAHTVTVDRPVMQPTRRDAGPRGRRTDMRRAKVQARARHYFVGDPPGEARSAELLRRFIGADVFIFELPISRTQANQIPPAQLADRRAVLMEFAASGQIRFEAGTGTTLPDEAFRDWVHLTEAGRADHTPRFIERVGGD